MVRRWVTIEILLPCSFIRTRWGGGYFAWQPATKDISVRLTKRATLSIPAYDASPQILQLTHHPVTWVHKQRGTITLRTSGSNYNYVTFSSPQIQIWGAITSSTFPYGLKYPPRMHVNALNTFRGPTPKPAAATNQPKNIFEIGADNMAPKFLYTQLRGGGWRRASGHGNYLGRNLDTVGK